jgi:DNA-binding NarL/FixJ family response regulator
LLIPSEDLRWRTVRAALDERPEAAVVGEVTTIADAAAAIPRLRPDLILSATALAGASIVPLLRSLRGCGVLAGRIALLMDDFDPSVHADFTELDLAGILRWSDLTATTLIPCLLLLLASAVQVCSRQHARPAQPVRDVERAMPLRLPRLTARERMIITGMAAGLTQERIAYRACITDRTVKRTLAALMDRFEAPSPFALAVRLTALGLMDVPIGTERCPEEDEFLSHLSLVHRPSPAQNGNRSSASRAIGE